MSKKSIRKSRAVKISRRRSLRDYHKNEKR